MIERIPGCVADVNHQTNPPHGLEPGWYGTYIHTDGSGIAYRTGPHGTRADAEAALNNYANR